MLGLNVAISFTWWCKYATREYCAQLMQAQFRGRLLPQQCMLQAQHE